MKAVLGVEKLLLFLDLLLRNIVVVHVGPCRRYKLTSLLQFWIELLITHWTSYLFTLCKPLLNLLNHALEALEGLVQAFCCFIIATIYFFILSMIIVELICTQTRSSEVEIRNPFVML